MQGWGPGTFSFNSGDGRCPTCMGSGFEHVEMQFLSDVYLRCPDCNGRRYRPEILQAKLERNGRSASVADVLEMTVSEACDFFRDDLEVISLLQPLIDVGLEYVQLRAARADTLRRRSPETEARRVPCRGACRKRAPEAEGCEGPAPRL